MEDWMDIADQEAGEMQEDVRFDTPDSVPDAPADENAEQQVQQTVPDSVPDAPVVPVLPEVDNVYQLHRQLEERQRAQDEFAARIYAGENDPRDGLTPSRQNGHEKASKNGLNRSGSCSFAITLHPSHTDDVQRC